MKINHGLIRKSLPVIFALITVMVFFYPVLVKKSLPYPADLLFGEYQPWRSYPVMGWPAGGVPHKAQYFDTIRQLYPWRLLVQDLFRQHQWPLWNPYNFSGTPLLANFQSAVFYPLRLLLFIPVAPIVTWTIEIMLQPLLSIIAMFYLLKHLKRSDAAAMIASISYGFCLYMDTFLEYNTIGHYLYLLPIGFLLIEKLIAGFNIFYIVGLALCSVLAVFAGHLQLSSAVIFSYLCYGCIRIGFEQDLNRIKYATSLLIAVLLGLGIGAVQLLPGIELILSSARSAHTTAVILKNHLVNPLQYFVYLIPDIYGNPATRNYQVTFSYPSKAVYIGIFPLLLAISIFFKKSAEPTVKTVRLMLIFWLSLILLTPVSWMLSALPLDIFKSSSPALFIFTTSCLWTVLCAYGYDNMRQNRKALYVIMGVFWIIALTAYPISKVSGFSPSLKNIIYSVIQLSLVTGFVVVGLKKNHFIRHPVFAGIGIILVAADLFYFFHKFNPFVPMQLTKVELPLIATIQNRCRENRVWGYGHATIEANFATQSRFYSADGYDPLYIKNYGQLLHASDNGNMPVIFTDQTRSDAVISRGFGEYDLPENKFRQKVLQITGTACILDKDENLSTANTFPPTEFDLLSKTDTFGLYWYKKAVHRYFVTGNYLVAETPTAAEKILFSDDFNPQTQITVNRKPGFESYKEIPDAKIHLRYYRPNSVSFSVNTPKAGLFYLSDSYYPGWQAYINGTKIDIMTADYAFRAVEIPAGNFDLFFKYEPVSFKYGLIVSLFSATVCLGTALIFSKRSR